MPQPQVDQLQQLQLALDQAVRAPQWLGFGLVGLALVVTLLGRHGQRPLNGALLGGAAALLMFFGLRGLHGWAPGVGAIIAGVLAALFGFVAVGWGTAFLMAAMLATGAGFAAHLLGLHPFLGAAPAAGIGLFLGMANHVRLSLWLPPLFSALLATLGATIAWAPHGRGASLYLLNDVRWVLGVAAGLLVPLLALSFERDYRKRKRLAARTKQMDDDALAKKVASQRSAFERSMKQ